jgi:hydroxyacylglutathione hydrolase
MKIEQIYTGCLAQGAYYIESNGEAAIIDPLREVSGYIKRANKSQAKIKYVFETHFHADFVSGHIDLANQTGATIVYGPLANPEFSAHIATDGEEFAIGALVIKALHTPGHTMESTTYLLFDEQKKPHAIFSGDTLFLGDVGRPDLAQKAADMTQEELAATLYDSLMNKIMPLPDDIIVYPGHGAGSACGKNMMKETVDTLGHQKETNYALNQTSKEAFVQAVLKGIQPPPAYFPMNVSLNKKGYNSFDSVMEIGLQALGAEEFEQVAELSEALVLDTRNAADFAQGFVPKSINIGLEGQFAPWVGALIVDVKQPLLLVTYDGKEEEAITRLARVGFDNVLGFLKGGIQTWIDAKKEVDIVHRITAEGFALKKNETNFPIVDVRKESEYEAEHIENAQNKPLDFINDWVNEVKAKDKFYLHCAGGYRSMMAASILKARGIHDFIEIEGGINAISKTNVPLTTYVCPNSLK